MKLKHVALAMVAVAVSAALIAHKPGEPTILPTVPGAVNASITQENIGDTICNPNWSTRSIRPSSAYTTALKVKQLKALNWNDQKTGDFEEDHLISLELGGNPTDPNNLWPEKYAEPYGARTKDKVENLLHTDVCNGTMTLLQAQTAIKTDWTRYIPISGPLSQSDE